MKKIGVIAVALSAAFVLAGCGNVSITVKTADTADAPQKPAQNRKEVAGPYGQLCIEISDDWECKVCPLDNDEMSYGYYGFTIHPKDKNEGIIAIFVANNFGVCGTGLKQEETVIAGRAARIGTYDDHKRWDFIVMGDESPQIVATGGACDSWTDDEWQEAQTIIGSIELDPTVTAGSIWQYTPESENTDIGVSMDLSDISPVGATVHFYRFDTGIAEELSYGDSYIIEKEADGKWEEVPEVAKNAAFNDIAHIIPANETVEAEINWEWLYGELLPGTYRLKKTVIEGGGGDHKEHELMAQFLIAGPR